MKLMNFDKQYLIMQNVKSVKRQPVPDTFTKSQYQILYSLVQRKHIKKQFFDFIVSELFEETDWKKLNYRQMYMLIHVLANWNYETEKGRTKA